MSNKKKVSFGRVTKFIKDVRSEMKKVTWPNRKELVSYTTVVFTTVILAAVFIWIVDIAFGRILGLIIR